MFRSYQALGGWLLPPAPERLMSAEDVHVNQEWVTCGTLGQWFTTCNHFLVWEGLVCESKRLQDIWLQDGTHSQQ